ncbi:MAG: cyclase family protein [Bryobacterales bacterium]|nr:cyclase family protein [Bryobacterales bacterium]
MRNEIIDISRCISPGALVYPGDPPILAKSICTIGPDSPYNLTQLGWTTHILTHIDSPRHFLENGASLDDLPLRRFMGPAKVIEVDGDAVLARHIPIGVQGMNLLFKTRNSERWNPGGFDTQHTYISREAAEVMAESGVNLAGIDYLSVDRFGDAGYPTHRALLGGDVLILEGLDLAHVEAGEYRLVALPLRIERGDGSPVRAVLLPGG